MGRSPRPFWRSGFSLSLIPLLAAGSFSLWPQEELAPEAPELILPPFLVEIDQEGPVMVEAPLPSEAPLGLPPLELPLPGPEELRFSPPASEVKMPVNEPAAETSPPAEGRKFFSRGRLGGGNGNYILGDISLFKLGEGPEFTLRFRHDSRDGLGGAPAGEGFALRKELLEGRLNLDGRGWSFDVDLAYREGEWGLQGIGDFDSLNLRRYTGGGAASFDVGSAGRFDLSADADWMERRPSGGTSDSREETLSLAPRGGFTWSTDRISLGITGSYRYDSVEAAGGETKKGHNLGGTLRLGGRLPRGWDVALEGGAVWRPGEGVLYPFSLTVAGPVGTFLFLTLAGGYRDRPYEPGALQEEHPFLAFRDAEGLPGVPASLNGWGGSLSLGWTPTEGLLVEGQGRVNFWENMIQPDAALSTGENSFRREARNLFSYHLSGGWLLHPLFHLSASWGGQAFLKADLLAPLTRLALRFEMGGEADPGGGTIPPWGGHIEGVWDVYSDESPYPSQYPKVEVSGYYEAAQGIRLIAEAKDLLSPLIDEDRLAWEGFKAPGFSVALLVGLSL